MTRKDRLGIYLDIERFFPCEEPSGTCSQRLKGKRGGVPGAEALIGPNFPWNWTLLELDRAKFGVCR